MLLIDTTTAATALDVSCGAGREASSAAAALVTPLNQLLSRVEGALDVITLERATFTDLFRVSGRGTNGVHTLRLSNAFVVPDSLTVTDRASGDAITVTDDAIDLRYGMVTVPACLRGTLAVTYTSGFPSKGTLDEQNVELPLAKQVFDLGVETGWLQSIAINALNEWFRSVPRTVKVSDTIAFRDINHQANRALQNAIWGRFMRPRFGVVWPVQSLRG